MKKKFLNFVLAICLIVPCLFMFSACGETPHEHDYKVLNTYSVDGSKAYLNKKCDCGESAKEELTNYVVATTDTAQEVLDTVENGKTIVLESGQYGNLYIRKNATSTNIESEWAGSGPHTFKRALSNVTIIGAEGAKVSSIVGEAQTYVPNGNYNSLSATHPFLNTYLEISNLTIKNVEFSPEENMVAVELASAGQKVSIDGLTIDNCTVNGTGTVDAGNRLFYSSSQTATSYVEKGLEVLVGNRKNITITNCKMNNLHQGIKLNFVENLTISGNQFNSIKGRDMLIGGGEGKILGNITISGNTSDGSTERVIRMSGLSGNLTVKNNVVRNYNGADADIVKINSNTGATFVFEGNDWNGKNDATAKADGVVNYNA